MSNITNTNPLPWKHTHEKEDIIGLQHDVMISDIYISQDEKFYWKPAVGQADLDLLDKTIPIGYGTEMMSEWNSTSFKEKIKHFEHVIVNKILDDRTNGEQYRNFVDENILFFYDESIKKQKIGFGPTLGLDLFRIIKHNDNLLIIAPASGIAYSVKNDNDSIDKISFYVSNINPQPETKHPNTLYFITET